MAKLFAIFLAALAVSTLAYDQEYEAYKARHAKMYRSVSKEQSWKNFNAEYRKQYRSAKEVAARKAIFLRNLDTIHDNHDKYERGLVKHFLGVTEFADMGHHEFRNTMARGMKLNETLNGVNEDVVIGGLSDPPASFDWNAQGKVTGAKNQGSCSSCWAFATMGVLEAQALIHGLGSKDLSEQQLVDCFRKTCDGSDPRHSLLWLSQQPGAYSESYYPYSSDTGFPGTCHGGTPELKSYSMAQLPTPVQDVDLKNYLMTNGPVTVGVESGNWPGPGVYQGGVIEFGVQGPPNNSWADNEIEALGLHAILLVGWDQDSDGQDYWIIKNSWGTSWGNQGFGKVGMGSDRDSGLTTYFAAYAPVVPS